jgi:excisionase family DNA binding protein
MRNEIPDFDELEAVTVREAAALLHVSEPTVRKYIKNRELPSAMIGRCRRIRRGDLAAFLDGRTAYGWHRHEPEAVSNDPSEEWQNGDRPIPF